MVDPLELLKVTFVGGVVNDNVPCSTTSVMVDKFVSASLTDNNFVPVKSKEDGDADVLAVAVIDVLLVELMGVPLKLLIGASLVPVTVNVSVVVDVAPLASLTS